MAEHRYRPTHRYRPVRRADTGRSLIAVSAAVAGGAAGILAVGLVARWSVVVYVAMVAALVALVMVTVSALPRRGGQRGLG